MSQQRDGFEQLHSDRGAVNDSFLQHIILLSSGKPNTGPHRALWSIWKDLWLSKVVFLPFLVLPFSLLFPMWKSPFNISPVWKALKGLRVALLYWICFTSQGSKTCRVAGRSRYPLFAKYGLANSCLNLQDIDRCKQWNCLLMRKHNSFTIQ